jgi:L,D-transpeptidase ErfK/SrfK
VTRVPPLSRLLLLLAVAALAASQQMPNRPSAPPPPVASHSFSFDPAVESVVGQVQRVIASEEDTLSDIARRFNLGYEEVVRANPGVDPWLPRAGTEIVLPTRFVLPDAPYEGVVVNLAALRLYYFPPRAEGELQQVITHPIGIGRVGWETPEGSTKVISKRKDPIWYVPASVRREHAAAGDPLPAQVPPGPDNPLGRHAMRLGWTSYLIHGTNNPYGVGLRNSHGCVRMYPEDIAQLYEAVPVGAPVTVVNQPRLYGWADGKLHLQALPALEDDKRDHRARDARLLRAALKKQPAGADARVEQTRVDALIADPRGIALPVTGAAATVEQYIARAPRVANQLPLQATWDGIDGEETANEEEPTVPVTAAR